MNFNFQKSRQFMVENQLRPNKINNPAILELFSSIKKEIFLRESQQNVAYSDLDLPIIEKRGYLKNLHIAQLIQFSNIEKNDKILHVGGLTGYVTLLLAHLSNKIICLENDKHLFEKLKNNLTNFELNNIELYMNDFKIGYLDKAPYDLIFIDNPIKKISNSILEQINPKLGKIIMIEKINDHLCKAVKITKDNNNYNKDILFDVFSKFELYAKEEKFVF